MLAVLAGAWLHAGGAGAQWLPGESDADNDAIRYTTSIASDPIAQLQRRIDTGTTVLRFDAKGGYLRSVLHELRIPIASQVLVFSKTSFQRALISPRTPRAIYFSHDVHVGWVQDGPVIEIASMDPALGAVFYTLRQAETARPTFQRQTRTCLQCHDSPSVTGGVPGLIVKSVRTGDDGEPIASAGTRVTSDRSPLHERWGGWYVTGLHGSQRHMGNAVAPHAGAALPADVPSAPNVTDLRARVNTDAYPSAHSDIVALMVLEHQSRMHNLMTRANYSVRMAQHFDRVRNQELGRPADYVPEATRSLVQRAAEPLVQALLFADAAPLAGPVSGTSGFSREFMAKGPRDRAGRSLRQLDLTRRLFRYPCSYLIYSDSFNALPAAVRDYVYQRLSAVLNGDDAGGAFAHLSKHDRVAIREILLETHPHFAAFQARNTQGHN